MSGGRPTKYTPELMEKAKSYLDDYEHHGAQFPSHIGLALYLDINTDTIYDWAKQESKKAFSDILAKILQTQHEMLIGHGISGDFNSNITKLVLGKHGYSEKHSQEHSGKVEIKQIERVVIDDNEDESST